MSKSSVIHSESNEWEVTASYVAVVETTQKIIWNYECIEIHIFELRNEEINVKKILTVINATYAVAKRKPEKIRLAGIRTLTSAIPVQHSNQLS